MDAAGTGEQMAVRSVRSGEVYRARYGEWGAHSMYVLRAKRITMNFSLLLVSHSFTFKADDRRKTKRKHSFC